jgi:hypothetical protein
VTNLQFCLVVGIPTSAILLGILLDRIYYKSMMAGFDRIDERFNRGFDMIDARFDRLDALFDRFEAKFHAHR